MGWRAPSKRCAAMQGALRQFGRTPREARAAGARYRGAKLRRKIITYQVRGLSPQPYDHLRFASDKELALHGARRMNANAKPGYPCRVTLDDAEPGETLLLVNHVSHDDGPYRASHAIFIGESATDAAHYVDVVPPALDRRILSIRAFGADGLMSDAALVQPGEADAAIRRMLADAAVDHLDAHYATRGCFAARVERT